MGAGEDMRIRGSIINGYLKFVLKTWGERGFEECRRDIGMTAKSLDEGRFYDTEVLDRILQWIHEKHGIEKVYAGGKFTIKNLGLLTYLVRFMSMENMLRKVRERYHDGYKYGNPRAVIEGKTARVEMRGVMRIPEDCTAWLGAFEGMLEMTKTKGTVEEVECSFKGGKCCTYEIKWG